MPIPYLGALTQIGRGVYRMLEAPAGRLSEFAEALALAGTDAVLADESVLAALDLTHVNLRRIRIASPRRVRVTLPPTVELIHRQIPEEDKGDVEGIPAMTVAAAIRGARGRVMAERLIEATRAAAARGLISPSDETSLLTDLGAYVSEALPLRRSRHTCSGHPRRPPTGSGAPFGVGSFLAGVTGLAQTQNTCSDVMDSPSMDFTG